MSQHKGHVTSSLETSFTCHATLPAEPFDPLFDLHAEANAVIIPSAAFASRGNHVTQPIEAEL